MSYEIEDEFFSDGDPGEVLADSSDHVNNNIVESVAVDNQDVNMNYVNDGTMTNHNDEGNQNIPAPVQGEGGSNRQAKSKVQKKEEKEKLKEEKRLKYRKALDELSEGKFKSVNSCAKAHGIPARTLYTLHSTGQDYRGSGKALTVFTKEEEEKIATYIRHQVKYGFGLSYFELQRTIQELAEGLSKSNPRRKFPETWSKLLPEKYFVYNFAMRHLLTLRSTMELNKARSIVSREDLELWQSDTEGGLVFHPDFADCWSDPRRIFNQVK